MSEAKTSTSTYIMYMLMYTVLMIVISTIVAIPLKYIFLDYFSRIGWATDFSLLTVIMALLSAKYTVSFILWKPKNSVQRSTSK